MSIWRPYSFEDVAAEEIPLDLSGAQLPQPIRVVSPSSAAPAAVYPTYSVPGYPCLPLQALHGHHGPAGNSPGSSSGYQSASARSPSPLIAPLAVSSLRSSIGDLEDGDGDISDDPEFKKFESAAMSAMAERNGGNLISNNPRMRRSVRSQAHAGENESYRLSRERNNAAAKQSRDRRKLREIHLSLKVTFLKQQLATLRATLRARACARCHRSALC